MIEICISYQLQIIDFLAVLDDLKWKNFFVGQLWWPTIFHNSQPLPQEYFSFLRAWPIMFKVQKWKYFLL